ncbi:dual specificity protein phosphatase family protein [Streptomyces ipomoeae]|uniref:protein-tyrosine phosphatase family protein n=1 Tax=Streptomyces ipomoeae TaxID=103232 RepID=UPI0029AE8F91|nr:dual specificity protein phosphatase family protein [Streptomyces ipomoeae]MDX2823985.1 dual specificity protein phosphatase family protein [Streptomyces ipomoeae]MDX2876567.1 dual specificity protein phosphatase family protein [Streptomyces ipomoeae]
MSVTLVPSPTQPGPLPTDSGRAGRLRRRIARIAVGVLLSGFALWATGTVGVLALSYVAREANPAPEGARTVRGIHNFQPVGTDGKLWRGAAPSPAGYRELADLGFTTVVDLRAEDLNAAQLAEPREAGLDVVRVPMRDGQTPTPEQVQRLLDTVARSSGPVFVHCGAGVGRTGTMAASYLVRTGQADSSAAVWSNLSVGPPSIEQIYYGLSLEPDRATEKPPLPVVAVSRFVDAPRRMWSYL